MFHCVKSAVCPINFTSVAVLTFKTMKIFQDGGNGLVIFYSGLFYFEGGFWKP
jgi:hypothetical protein